VHVIESPGLHSPAPLHAPQSFQRPVFGLQVRECVPQKPHGSLLAPVHSWPGHALSHSHVLEQVCVPPEPQLRVVPGAQSPWLVHALQFDHCPVFESQLRTWIPQLPQLRLLAPVHTCPVHAASHMQLPPHFWVPPLPHTRAVLGAHWPSPMHELQSDHSPVFMSQVRVRVPHRPQLSVAGPTQRWPVQATSHLQSPPQVRVPLRPHIMVVFGWHSLSPRHSPHADQVADAMSQVRVCVPQLPQAPLAAPGQGRAEHSPH
jgi:hypothetical protein